MERDAARLAERIKDAKVAKAKADREARRAAALAERENHQIRMFKEYAEPFGVPWNVADKVYAMAWENGHSSGYDEVEGLYQDFAELARVAYEQGIEDAS